MRLCYFSLVIFLSCNTPRIKSEVATDDGRLDLASDSLNLELPQRDSTIMSTAKSIEIVATCHVSGHNTDYTLQHLLDSAEIISKNSSDSCMLSLLDALMKRCIETSTVEYLNAMEGFCAVKDGYISEYFLVLSERIYRKQFEGYMQYLYVNRDACLKNVFIESLSVEIGMAKHRKQKKKEVTDFIDEKIKEQDLNRDVAKFIKTLESQVDESILD